MFARVHFAHFVHKKRFSLLFFQCPRWKDFLVPLQCWSVFPRTVISDRFLMMQVSSMVVKLHKEAPRTFILSNNNIPSRKYWDLAVNRALQKISRSDSALTKVTWPFLVVTLGSFSCLEFSDKPKVVFIYLFIFNLDLELSILIDGALNLNSVLTVA